MTELSVFTPLPPTPSGISDYSVLLLETLVDRGWDVTAFAPEGAAPAGFPIRDPSESSAPFSGRRVYHIGNSEHHDFIYPHLLEHPDVLVLHDLVLHHARLSSTLNSPEVSAYRADLGNRDKRADALRRIDSYAQDVEAVYPGRGEAVAEIAVRMGGGRLLYAFPLYEDLVARSALTLVHSESARREILERCPDASVQRIRMGIEPPEVVSREDARKKLEMGTELVLASFGLITPEKRIPTALAALRKLLDAGVEASYVLVGDTVSHYDVGADAEAHGVSDHVRFAGRVSDEDFALYAFASDICLNLRYPSAGETSATLLRLLSCGRAVLVTDQVHVEDFPDTIVARTRLEGDEDGLYCDLMDLMRSETRRRALESASRAFVIDQHSPKAMTDDYTHALSVTL